MLRSLRTWCGSSAKSPTGSAIPTSSSTTPARGRGPVVELDPADAERALAVGAFGGFLVGQQAAKRMLAKDGGAIAFTSTSASVEGYPLSVPFAMGKFALRGLAQSLRRELARLGINVAHFVIDGARRTEPPDRPDRMLSPDATAESYWHVRNQPRSAWSWEGELRPWAENF